MDAVFVEDEIQESMEGGHHFGDYQLLDELGRGGMGAVYRARHSELSRVVALKMVLPTHLHSETERARFHRESEAIASLDHPNILPIYEVGEHRGQPFFTMKLCVGNLAEAMRNSAAKYRIPEVAARLISDLARAVHHAHERGIQHRDLKPSNVLLDGDGRVQVSDFGLARFCDRESTLTQPAAVLGTPAYLAPETAGGQTRDVTNAADLYSLGAILYELLAARPLFAADSALETLRLAVETEPVVLRKLDATIPRDLETICLKCLRKDPAARYASARELAEDLNRFLAGKPVHARPVRTPERLWRWCRRRPIRAALLAALGLGAMVSVWQIDAARRAQSRETARAESFSGQLQEANLALARTNTELATTIDIVELQRAEDLFHAGDSGRALAFLARVLARHPGHPVAGSRLASAFLHGDFARPAGSPFRLDETVVHLEVMRDGETLFITTASGLAGLWDAATGQQRIAFRNPGHRLQRAQLLGDGSEAVGWNASGDISIWNTVTGQLLMPTIHLGSSAKAGAISQPGTTLANPERAWRIAFSADGARFAAAAAGAIVRIWAVRPDKMLFTLPSVPPPVQQVAFSPDGRWLLVAAGDAVIHGFSAADGREASSAIRHEGEIRWLQFSADSRWLVTAGSDKTARIWNAGTGEATGRVLRHGDWINSAVFSPDGERVVTTSGDNSARVWETRTGRPLSQPLSHLEQPLTAAFSLDGTTLFTAGADRIVRRWDVRPVGAPPALLRHESRVEDAEFSRDGRLIATGAEDGRVCVWATGSFKPVWNGGTASPPARLVAFDPAGSRLAIAGGSGASVENLDAAKGTIGRFEPSALVFDFCFSPDGRQLAVGASDKTASIWNLETGTLAIPPLEHAGPVVSVRFSPDGHTLLTGQTVGNSAQLWNVRTGSPIGHAMVHEDSVSTAEFSPDGKLVATASADDEARVWDAATGAPVSPPLRHRRTVSTVAFSPDSRLVATASRDGTAQIWDVRTGQRVGRTMLHEDHVLDVRFSPNGRRLATTSKDKTARVWDVATGLPVTEPLRHPSEVRRVRFSPDGQRLLTVSDDSAARVWEVPEFEGQAPAWLTAVARTLAADTADSADIDAEETGFARARAQAEVDPGEGQFARLARWLFHGHREGESFTDP
ncbi:MAG: protein kinase [Chthoniobacteraceae bacterium]